LAKNAKHAKVSKNSLLFIRNVEFLEVAYTYARDLALRIENGIAVMPISILDTFNTKSVFKNNAEYVIVNKDKNSEINFIIKTIL
jgi:hypothetical protein